MKLTPRRFRRRPVRTALVSLAAGIAVAGVAAGVIATLPERSREQEIAERSAQVMPFDLAATTHHFEPTAEAGGKPWSPTIPPTGSRST